MSNVISFELADGCYVARWNHFSTVRQQCRHDASVCGLSRVDAQIEVGARYLRTGQCGLERDETNYGVRAWAFARRLNVLTTRAPTASR